MVLEGGCGSRRCTKAILASRGIKNLESDWEGKRAEAISLRILEFGPAHRRVCVIENATKSVSARRFNDEARVQSSSMVTLCSGPQTGIYLRPGQT